jgi:hypothetical protein
MTFQAYLNNIKANTGMTPDDFHQAAGAVGLLTSSTTATEFVGWLGKEYGLGRGHAMAIFAVFKQRGWISGNNRAPTKSRKRI